MLSELVFEAESKQVALQIETPDFARLLEAVLEVWGYAVVPESCEPGMLLIEQGGAGEKELAVIRLGSASGVTRLSLPLVLAQLWAQLEQRFHQPARQHLRVALDLEVEVVARNRFCAARLQSLSDMGGRLVLDRELVRDEGLLLRLAIGPQVFQIGARVIYALHRSDGEHFEIGMLFPGVEAGVRQALRHFIGQQILAAALARAGEPGRGGLELFRPD